MTHQSHSWAYIQTTVSLKKTHAPHVHCSSIHNSQDMETTQMSTDTLLHQEDVVSIHNGILLSHKKEQKMPFAATWMELETLIQSEVRKRKTKTV